MDTTTTLAASHPLGDAQLTATAASGNALLADTYRGRIHVEWDSDAPVTPMGQLAFFVDFLKTADLFVPWVSQSPLTYTSNNAPKPVDVLGTLLLSVLAGHWRYGHIATLRCDRINPSLLGMSKIVSVDSARRAFVHTNPEDCCDWQQRHLHRSCAPLLVVPWIMDVDTSVKVLYGHQQGAVVGYNPTKPGRPSHVLHTYFMANTRLVLDVEIRPGNETAACYTMPGLWAMLDKMPREQWPFILRGDCAFGNERDMNDAEERGLKYLFKLRQTSGVKRLIEQLFSCDQWCNAGQGWEGMETSLRLQGWSRTRRVVVLRRRIRDDLALKNAPVPIGQAEFSCVEMCTHGVLYEYAVLVTTLTDAVETVAQLYRDRADAENIYDELKNQWGWGGYTTRDMHRCQVMARIVAQVYNWWSIYAGLAVADRHVEAITSRPLLLYAVGKQVQHAGRTMLSLTSVHAKEKKIKRWLNSVAAFLEHIRITARQLNWEERWRLIMERSFARLLQRQNSGHAPPVPVLT
ncbi:MAG: Transposase DDE domain protein [Candidatus Hydrogenedentes bacterium ADurb.Bin179]|nr:MAG: Transposase DDE domain protein [Candidatus Hydrogenedentes bacterium ADurb.Bin179]